MEQVLTLLKEYGLYREAGHNKTANIYTTTGRTARVGLLNITIYFFSIDEVSRIKSLNLNYA